MQGAMEELLHLYRQGLRNAFGACVPFAAPTLTQAAEDGERALCQSQLSPQLSPAADPLHPSCPCTGAAFSFLDNKDLSTLHTPISFARKLDKYANWICFNSCGTTLASFGISVRAGHMPCWPRGRDHTCHSRGQNTGH